VSETNASASLVSRHVSSSRLTDKECRSTFAIVHLLVMDHDLMWSNDFEGEAFLDIGKLCGVHVDTLHESRTSDELKPIELTLTHPKGRRLVRARVSTRLVSSRLVVVDVRSRIMDVLEQRLNDKTAMEFVRRRRETENQ
jgi:hypothetical protein